MWVVFAHLASAVDGVEHFPGLILHIVVTVKKSYNWFISPPIP